MVDVKSASDFSFRKFSHRTLFKGDDPFGYIGQISAYMEALNFEEGAFFAINKNSGELYENILSIFSSFSKFVLMR